MVLPGGGAASPLCLDSFNQWSGIKECQKQKRAPGSPHDSRVSEMRYPVIWGTIIQYVFWRYIRPGSGTKKKKEKTSPLLKIWQKTSLFDTGTLEGQ